jgi:putrescine transport system permease protein
MKPRAFAKIIFVLGIAFLYLPLLFMIGMSFNASLLANLWGGFSFQWYGQVLKDPDILEAAVLSVIVAAISATLAVLIGVLTAWGVQRTRLVKVQRLLVLLSAAPLVIPELLFGLGLMLLFILLRLWLGWPQRGALTIILAHATFASAFVAVVVAARLQAVPRNLEEAAADLGSSPLDVLRRITLPLILPAMIAGWLLAFTVSIDDYVVASFVSGPGATTLPMLLWSKLRLGLSPQINAIATLMILVVACSIVSAALLMRLGADRK